MYHCLHRVICEDLGSLFLTDELLDDCDILTISDKDITIFL